MTADMFNTLRSSVKTNHPLIHCITNAISINQCANAVLAVGARPIMAENPDEVKEITATAASLMLNLGNISDAKMKAMTIASSVAKEKNIPIMLDLVGISCSSLRRRFARGLAQGCHPTVLKGNYSEITALYNLSYSSSGVDAETTLNTDFVCKTAAALAKKYNAVILASGKTDIVTDGKKLILINNGTPMLSSVTGTGCMLGALCASFLSACPDITSAACACVVMGICGELAHTEKGNGSFMTNLLDALSVLSDETLKKRLKTEEIILESI